MTNTSILAAFERMWQHVVTALGNKSDSDHTHDISDITGTVPITQGGTGATNVEGAKTNLGFLTANDFTVSNGVLTLNFL